MKLHITVYKADGTAFHDTTPTTERGPHATARRPPATVPAETIQHAIRYTDPIHGNTRTIRNGSGPSTLAWAEAAMAREVDEWAGYDIGCHIVYRDESDWTWRSLPVATALRGGDQAPQLATDRT
jgi:hypothetical protein